MRSFARTTALATAFAATLAAGAAAAQTAPIVPNPADIVTVGVGSIQTGSPPDGQQVIGVNIGDTPQRGGSTATATLLGGGPVTDVSVDSMTGRGRTEAADVAAIGAGPLAVTKAGDGNSVLGVNLASAAPTTGSTATLGVASGGQAATVGLGGSTLGVPTWTGMPGLKNLPLTLPRLGGR